MERWIDGYELGGAVRPGAASAAGTRGGWAVSPRSQAVKDAMADAAQMRVFLSEGVTPAMVAAAEGFGARHVPYFAIFGTWGVDAYGRGADSPVEFLALPEPHATAALRARAAFRAVPSLREKGGAR